MKTIIIKVYKFDELTEDAKNKAIEELWDINLYYEWWVGVYEDAEEVCLKITEFDLHRNRFAKGEFVDSATDCANKILENHGKICETYKTAENFLKERDEIKNGDFEDEYEKRMSIDECESDFLKSILEDYSVILEKEYEYIASREAIIETIKSNDYDFTADGKLFK